MKREQSLLRKLVVLWKSHGGWSEPDLTDSIDFLATEVAEVIDARLRLTGDYVRQHGGQGSAHEIAQELGDVFLMAMVTCEILGVSAQDVFLSTLRKRCRKSNVNWANDANFREAWNDFFESQ